MSIVFLILILVSPFLLLTSYLLLANTRSFWKIFVAHTVTFVIYMLFVLNYSKLITGHDEYGLGKFALGVLFVVVHIIIGFTQAVSWQWKSSTQRQIRSSVEHGSEHSKPRPRKRTMSP